MTPIRHPTPRSPDEMARETMGTIIGVCRDMERCAEAMDVNGLNIHYDFLKTTMRRLDVIRMSIRQRPAGT